MIKYFNSCLGVGCQEKTGGKRELNFKVWAVLITHASGNIERIVRE